MSRSLARIATAVVLSSALALTACSPGHQKDSESKVNTASKVAAPSSMPSTSESTPATAPLTFTDAFVKATGEGKTMTAIFGTLTNTTDSDITVVGFTTSINAPRNEIHEVVDGKMREREGGLPVPAHSTAILKPGGDHFMLMELTAPVMAGDTVDMTITLSDGTSVDVKDIPVRTINSGQESYNSNGGVEGNSGMTEMNHEDHAGHEGHDHEGHDHH